MSGQAKKEILSVSEAEQGLSRREFLARSGAVGAAGALPAGMAGAAHGAQPLQEKAKPEAKTTVPMVKLGNTGVKVSRLALGGSWNIDHEVLSVGFDLGVNYIDTAESYLGGRSERAIGEFLKNRGATGRSAERKKIWLVSKTHSHRQLDTHLQGCLERLQQDYVDCFYMHQIADPKLPLDPDIKAMAAKMKKAGKTRFFGFSCHDEPVVQCLNAAADSDFIDVIMFRYDCHYYPREELMKAIDRCSKKGIGLVAMKTQVGGMTLPDKFNPFKQRGLNQHQAAIKAVGADERIHAICSEITTVDMMQQNAEAVASKLTIGEAAAIKEHARLVSHLWCRGCDHICRAACGTGERVAVADTLRFLMYHDHYGKRDHARELFAGLSEEKRDLQAIEEGDWEAAQSACPYNVPLPKLMSRVRERLA